MKAEAIPPGISGAIPRQVWVLGLVSLLMDVSSEIVQTLLPLYLVVGLGASAVTVGFIEGFSIAVAMVTRLSSGYLSDWFGNRKLLAALGYGLAAISKPLFPLADSLYWIVGAKFLDRVGKGIRAAPRDALIADITPAEIRGASFGLRKSLDTVGGFVGPIAAIALMLWTGGSFSTIFWIAVIPAFLAVGLLMACVKEPDVPAGRKQAAALKLKDAVRLNRSTWVVIFVSSILAIARFSEAFLLLRSQQVGFSFAWVPATMVIMHLVYGLAVYPVGMLSDRIGRNVMLGIGLLFLLAGDLVLAYTATIPLFILGIVLWGLHMGFSQGILATLIADTAPSHLRGTAFGVFSLTTGLLALAGNLAAGVLWEQQGAQATFLMGALLSVAAILGLPLLRKYSAKPLLTRANQKRNFLVALSLLRCQDKGNQEVALMTDRIEKSIEINAPVERVWRALTDYKEFGEWFRVKLDGPFVAGEVSTGHITYPGYEHLKWEATIKQIEQPRLFSMTWHPYAIDPNVDYSGETPTLVEFRLEPTSTGTRLTVTESGFNAVPKHRMPEAMRMNEGGWEEQVKNIKTYVEQ